ncbi:lipopolysaccharide assembly protein LapB [Hahella sp. SMD15-11]|uniref:Lipopolysaccharide assembly protein B n=1 Tax=Thermohahella caldifontis TaxID=3142973 RepID=A0AB39UWX2_9GAMM
MSMLTQWLLVATAVALGWALGYWQNRRPASSSGNGSSTSGTIRYPKAVHYLFDAYDAPTLDSFVHSLPVNRDTIPIHLSLAHHYRRRGEVEKATILHQNLLAHPEVRVHCGDQVQFELAEDYLAAGLYDRAESILLELRQSPDWKARATLKLLDIYEHEKDWEIARDLALSLDHRKDRTLQIRLAHYCCEIAERANRRGDWNEAREQLRAALNYDRGAVRASLALARLCISRKLYAEAVGELKRIEQQDVGYLGEAIGLLDEALSGMGQREKMQHYFERYWQLAPSTVMMVSWAQYKASVEGRQAAIDFLLEQLDEHPNLRGVSSLVMLLYPMADEDHKHWIRILNGVVESIIERTPHYVCEQCGFTGRQLHWQCPSCKHWSTVKPKPWI